MHTTKINVIAHSVKNIFFPQEETSRHKIFICKTFDHEDSEKRRSKKICGGLATIRTKLLRFDNKFIVDLVTRRKTNFILNEKESLQAWRAFHFIEIFFFRRVWGLFTKVLFLKISV